MWLAWWVWGWTRDVRTYWHRARYGWAPRDVWSLDTYLDGVLGGALARLGRDVCSYPSDYPGGCEQWEADLNRWAVAFQRVAADDYYEIHGRDFAAWNADEAAREKARNEALAEMLPWWGALWN